MNNICIVGYGSVGPVHAYAVEKTDNANLYAICDTDEKKLELAKENHRNIVAYNDFETMLLDDNITSIHICTPHYLHFEMAKKAILKGKDVVLEKPATMLKSEFDELKKLCGNSQSKVCIMFQNRTCNCVKKIKKLCAELGELKGIYAALTWHRDMNYYNHDTWRGKWNTEGGGVLINQAIHLLDLVSYIGGGISKVNGNISTKALDIEVEDTADVLFTLNNGARACFYATNAYACNSPFRLEIVFDGVTLKYENKNLYKIVGQDSEIIETDNMNYCGKDYWGSGHEKVITEFYNNGKYPTIYDVENTMNTLFAIYESAKKEREISI